MLTCDCSHHVVCWKHNDATSTIHCAICGHLGLGPARDTDATAIELRAAEIAADLEQHGGCFMSALEQGGFLDMPLPLRGGGTIDLTGMSGASAGYLARCIVEHDTEVV